MGNFAETTIVLSERRFRHASVFRKGYQLTDRRRPLPRKLGLPFCSAQILIFKAKIQGQVPRLFKSSQHNLKTVCRFRLKELQQGTEQRGTADQKRQDRCELCIFMKSPAVFVCGDVKKATIDFI